MEQGEAGTLSGTAAGHTAGKGAAGGSGSGPIDDLEMRLLTAECIIAAKDRELQLIRQASALDEGVRQHPIAAPLLSTEHIAAAEKRAALTHHVKHAPQI